jgi:hypothetical protein
MFLNVDKLRTESEILDWIKSWLEVDHKFYDYKFPPCPYARAARLKDQVTIQAWTHGSWWKFIQQQAWAVVADPTKTVSISVFPAEASWAFWLPWQIQRLNKQLVHQDYYAQYGVAVKTRSCSSFSLARHRPYFIVIVNRLSDVLAGHRSLLKTDYYQPWSPEHYQSVVTRREEFYNKETQNVMD